MWLRIALIFITLLPSGRIYGNITPERATGGTSETVQVRSDPTQGEGENADIDWFRDQLKISPKYQEKEEGVFGLSWAHFLTMIFLICSFILALIALIARHKRTKVLLNLLLQNRRSQNQIRNNIK